MGNIFMGKQFSLWQPFFSQPFLFVATYKYNFELKLKVKNEILIEMTKIPRMTSLIASFCRVLLKSLCLNNWRSFSRKTCESIQLSFAAVDLDEVADDLEVDDDAL